MKQMGRSGSKNGKQSGKENSVKQSSVSNNLQDADKNNHSSSRQPESAYQADTDGASAAAESAEVGGVEEEAAHYRGDETSLDATTLYLNEIGYLPLLNAEQEVQLAREVALGSRPSKNRMIESNLRLVVAIAKRFQNRGLCLLDLVEEGNLGLIRAVEKYDPNMGYRFSTYATWWIKQAIDRALMNHSQTIRYPIHVMKDIQACVRASEQLRDLLAREPSFPELAAKTGKSVKEVKRLMGLHIKFCSADQLVSEDSDSTLIDNISSSKDTEPQKILETRDIESNVDVWLGKLSQRHRDVVVRRFGLQGHEDGTLEKVGEDVGITRERVRQLQIEALGKLRRMMERDGFFAEHLHD
ncbi:MAG: sigma-70 family RNA polymerase sigma factor [Pseudomonadota bacterium]